MNIIRFSIDRPVTIAVGVIIVLLFGFIGLQRLPYQLSPTVIEPDITVSTTWRGATPYEIEREIIEVQENTLKGIPGLKEMESESQNGMGTITLKFKVGSKVDEALLRVTNQINEVRRYPEGADKPVIRATGASANPVIWLVMKTSEGNARPIDSYVTFFEDEIRQYLDRVDGVADLFIGGGTPSEMHIIIKPEMLAAYGLTTQNIISAVQSENVNISAGNLGVGRRDYRIRTTGEFKDEEDIGNLVLRSTGEQRIHLKDVAEIKRGYAKQNSTVLHNGDPGLVVGIRPETGTNILELTQRMEETVNWLNEHRLKPEGIYFQWVYDQRFYINGAIGLIKSNILVGGALAIIVLLLFLRSIRSTIVVATAIPISVIGTFVFMYIMGRNLNVVSLAGIAFAVGMLVDNAIVVIENIDRHRMMGKNALDAAYDGTQEVWGAVLASTLTTIAVFLPVVFIQEEAGQLFRDIAIAVVSSVSLSLIVSVTVIPMLSKMLFEKRSQKKVSSSHNPIVMFGNFVNALITGFVSFSIKTWPRRIVTIVLLTSIAVGASVYLMPKREYLPQGKRNFLLNILVPPPGLSNQERQEIAETFFSMAEPYIQNETYEGNPGIKDMFFVGRDSIMIAGAIAKQWDRASELKPLFQKMIFSVPGMVGVSTQPGIFQRSFSGGRSISYDLTGNDLNTIVRTAGMMFVTFKGALPSWQVRPRPSIELLYPEVRIEPDRDRLKANAMSTADLGVSLDVLLDGRNIGDFKEEGKKKIDLILKTATDSINTPEELFESLVVTPGGRSVPVSSLASLKRTTGITTILHLERDRAISLQIIPPDAVPMEEAIDIIEEKVIAPMKQQGMFKDVELRMSGAADQLKETGRALSLNFVLAAVIAYLLMAALFGNFIYPIIIMFTVPLAGAGGVLGLRILNLYVLQTMDILTMLGFVILIGVVVNNAILIVHQALNNLRYNNMDHRTAVIESVQSRLRPIYMSATTSVFGMLPLVVFPGAGSELYRGLGSVILGGISVSTVFTVFVIPSLLMFVIKMEPTNIRQQDEPSADSGAITEQPTVSDTKEPTA